MRIHFIGSAPDNNYERTPQAIEHGLHEYSEFFNAAAQLGQTAAERGHTLVVGSDFPLTIDHHIVRNGMVPVIIKHPERTFYLEVWRPNDEKCPPFEELRTSHTNLKIEYFVRRPGFPLQQRLDPHAAVTRTNLWTFAHQSAVANADAVLAMGGTTGTELAVHMAEQLRVPIFPIKTFGGGAEKAYETLESKLIELPNGYALSAPWSNQRSVDIIELVEKAGTHSYFLSYSHNQIEWCDLVHLALYTRGRVVLRDRDELSIGREVQPKLMDAIGKAETFILLWSKEAMLSPWCKLELERALYLQQQGLPPRRIVLLRRDDTPPPESLKETLWLEAADRRLTDHAVNQIVNEEAV